MSSRNRTFKEEVSVDPNLVTSLRGRNRVSLRNLSHHIGRKDVGMRALTWHGKNDIRCDTIPDSKIEHGRDAIIKVTACAICGSDLHLFDGVMPTMEKGDVLG